LILAWNLNLQYAGTKQNVMPWLQLLGVNSLPCFLSVGARKFCVKSAEAWRRVKETSAPGFANGSARSTLAYANEHRPWQLQQTIFGTADQVPGLGGQPPGTRKKSKFRFRIPC